MLAAKSRRSRFSHDTGIGGYSKPTPGPALPLIVTIRVLESCREGQCVRPIEERRSRSRIYRVLNVCGEWWSVRLELLEFCRGQNLLDPSSSSWPNLHRIISKIPTISYHGMRIYRTCEPRHRWNRSMSAARLISRYIVHGRTDVLGFRY
jgi:hypothetical protein